MKNILKSAVEEALNKLYSKNNELFQNDSHEISMVNIFERYLYDLLGESYLKEFDFDLEYNRKNTNIKKVLGKKIRPDLIIHKRNLNGKLNNYCVFEFKKKNEDESKDIKKLCAMTKLDGEYAYQYGYFIQFNDNSVYIKIYVNGILKEEYYMKMLKE